MMKNLDDKYFFDRVKSVLEDFEPDYRPDRWTELSTRLDRGKSPVGPVRWRMWLNGFICGALTVSIMVGIYYMFFENKDNISAPVLVETNQPLPDNPVSGITTGRTADSHNHTSGNRTQAMADTGQITGTKSRPSVPKTKLPGIPVSVGKNILPKYGMDTNKGGDESTDTGTVAGRSITSAPPNQDAQVSDYAPAMRKGIRTDTISRQTPEVTVLADISIKNDYRDSCLLAKDSTKVEKKSKKQCRDLFRIDLGLNNEVYDRFTGPDRIKLYYSPEFVFGSFQDKPGWSNGAGIMMEGPLNKRIMVAAGVAFRNYAWQKKTDFKKDSASIISRPAIDSTHVNEGHWRYFEIPLALGLNVVSGQNWNMGINVALAAQIMQHERYVTTRITNRETSTCENIPDATHYAILGSLRFGLEYRYRLSDRWGLWVEPYYRFQLNSIGVSGLKPQYLGINAGLVYQFNLHRKKR